VRGICPRRLGLCNKHKGSFHDECEGLEINPASCATKMCHQVIKTTYSESTVFLIVDKCSGRCVRCASGVVKICIQNFMFFMYELICSSLRGSVLLMWHVIRYCCKSVFSSFILLTKDTSKKIIDCLRSMDSPLRRYCLAANKGTNYLYVDCV
jgi:hypothetical protein